MIKRIFDYFNDLEEVKEASKLVIDDIDLDTDRFTPSYIFALNRCWQQAISDPSSITTAEYWQRHRAALNVQENR